MLQPRQWKELKLHGEIHKMMGEYSVDESIINTLTRTWIKLPVATVKLARRALIVSLAFRNSNSKTATLSSTPRSPSSEYLVRSNESRVAWLEDLAA
jgi:hypothetical protein